MASKWAFIQIPATAEEKVVYFEACRITAEELGVERLPMKQYFKLLLDKDVARLRKKYKTK